MKNFVRVTGGDLSGRKVETPGIGTHPSGSRMREGIFNTLGPLEGIRVLDLYSGSGIFAIESISRGAVHATCVDISPKALDGIRKAAEEFKIIDKISILQADVEKYINNHLGEEKIDADIVFFDPPYPQFSLEIVTKLGKTLANKNALMVVSHPGEQHLENELDGLVVVKERTYSDAHVTYLKQT